MQKSFLRKNPGNNPITIISISYLVLKGKEMRKFFVVGTIIIITILPMILALFVFRDGASTFVWSLYIIPNYLIFLHYSNWTAAIITNLAYTILEIVSQHYFLAPEISENMLLIVLVLVPLIHSIIFFILASYRIKFKKVNDQLIDLVEHDSLTGIYNRRYFDRSIEKYVAAFASKRNPFQLIMFDIDHFKKINDTYGHPCGDYVLKELTRVFTNEVRSMDVCTRIGGEEFAILLPNTNAEEGAIIAHRIRKSIEELQLVYNNTIIPVTISIGVATYCGGALNDLIDKADTALYKAKNNGRNQVIIADH